MREELIKIAIANQGDYFRIKKDVENNCYYSNEEIPADVEIVTILDFEYPKQLLRLDKPPFVLFCIGDVSLLKSNSISVVGSRKYSYYGSEICKQVVSGSDATIISGLAYGIDSIAHTETLKQNKKTIAVIGSGFNHIYPKAHIPLAKRIMQSGLIVSEYPPSVVPAKRNFPMRNRIIAALSRALYVCEAKKKSGTKITADMALEVGNEIFCGYSTNDKEAFSGTIELINEGANIICLEKNLDKQ